MRPLQGFQKIDYPRKEGNKMEVFPLVISVGRGKDRAVRLVRKADITAVKGLPEQRGQSAAIDFQAVRGRRVLVGGDDPAVSVRENAVQIEKDRIDRFHFSLLYTGFGLSICLTFHPDAPA